MPNPRPAARRAVHEALWRHYEALLPPSETLRWIASERLTSRHRHELKQSPIPNRPCLMFHVNFWQFGHWHRPPSPHYKPLSGIFLACIEMFVRWQALFGRTVMNED